MTNDRKEREAEPGRLKDEQTRRAVDQAERAGDERDRKNLGRSPENKVIGAGGLRGETSQEKVRRRRQEEAAGRDGGEGREAEPREGDEPEPGADGTVHLMEEEMKAAAKQKKAPAEQPPPPRVIHVMELEMKGEAVEDYIESNPHIDAGLPEPEEPPLGGKPPEPPLGGSRSSDRRGR
jgi:hypothetical protein